MASRMMGAAVARRDKEERDPWLAAFTRRLKEASQRFGKVDDSAAAAGLSAPTWDRYVNGRVEPYFLPIARFARALGVSLDWLAYGVEQAPEPPVNEELLAEIVARLEAEVARRGTRPTPAHYGSIVAMVYADVASSDEEDRDQIASKTVARALRLVS